MAEGYGLANLGEYLQFLGHARGSNCEVFTQLVIARGLSLGEEEKRAEVEGLCDEVAKMLIAPMKSLRN